MRLVMVSLTLAAAVPTAVKSARGDARAFMEDVFNRSSWKDMQADLELVLKNKSGDKRVKRLKLWSKNNDKGETSMLMRFTAPADVRGTGFLLIEHKEGRDDRRLFLPALRRVKRITGSGGRANFMSSDFSFYDIGKPKLGDWKFSFAGEETVGGVKCRAVEGVAASPDVVSDTGYSKVVWYVDPARKIVLAADYYDKDGTLFKKMKVLEVKDVAGRPFATHMSMQDVTTGHSSEMVFANLVTEKGIADSVFTERDLKRWRR